MIQNYLLAFAVGVLTQVTDWQVDEKLRLFRNAEYLTGFLYGAGAIALALQGSDFATLVIALTVGILFAGKIDKPAHQLAIAAIFLGLAFFGLPAIDLVLFVLILLVAFADELVHDWVTAVRVLGRKTAQLAALVGENRLLLPAFMLAYWLHSGNANYFLALFFFDFAAYRTVDVIVKKFFKIPLKTRGTHLVLDLFDCSERALKGRRAIRGLLESLPEMLGMRKISPAFVFGHAGGTGYDEGGISGIVLIAESHISVHTFPAKKSAQADVFSCKAFDAKKTEALIAAFFKARKARARVLKRSEPH